MMDQYTRPDLPAVDSRPDTRRPYGYRTCTLRTSSPGETRVPPTDVPSPVSSIGVRARGLGVQPPDSGKAIVFSGKS